MRREVEAVRNLSRTLVDREALIELLSEIEIVRLECTVRLCAPTSENHQPDKLLTIDEAATRLAMSKDYLYRHKFPFTVREGGSLRFSSHGIDKYIDRRRTK